ncbi:MAG: hemolysin [Candidatus Riflebacteria bacterium HGW-Riflebacteria-2]|jgi:CBS domain containing-hemolysin-like protein|nr:MAG: hemolysin [Candidatus Riflebacteria bacterium HGW-Riflebacteria-2]
MDDAFTGILFCVCLVFSAFFSSAETAFFALSPLRLKKMEDEGDRKAGEILKLLADKQRMLITLLMGNTLVNVAATAIATSFFMEYLPKSRLTELVGVGPTMSVAVSSLIMTVVLLVFGEITPKTIAIFGAYGYSRVVVKPLRFVMFLFTPFSGLTIWFISKFFSKYSDWNSHLGSSTSMEEIDNYFNLGEEVGIIERDEKEMINSVFEFGDTLVREVMVPRPDIISMPINIGLDDLLQFIREDGHSRFPVYDENIDKVVGILYVKDILIKLDDIKVHYDLFKLLRPPFFVPETKKLNDLLSEFQKRKQHLSLVVDEYGGISGLVTIEDLLEEIVGEIVDEYDLEEQAPLNQLDENIYSIDARYSISDLEAELNCELEYEDSETVGGFVLEKLGRIPQRGESFEEPQGIFQVTEIKGNRILRVKFTMKSLLSDSPAAE